MSADVHALAGAYALDALPSDERAFFERHLAVCEACTTEVAELTETASRLGSAAAQAPPPDLRARILSVADVTRQFPPEPAPAPAVSADRRSFGQRMLMPVAACLALVAITLTGVNINLGRQLQVAQNTVASNERQLQVAQDTVAGNEKVVAVLGAQDLQTVELAIGTPSPGRFLFSPAQDRGVLVGHGMEDPGRGKTYELWLIHDGTPVPAGIFDPDTDGAAVAAVDGIVRDAERVAVTIEPAGGSQRPTGAIIASAEL